VSTPSIALALKQNVLAHSLKSLCGLYKLMLPGCCMEHFPHSLSVSLPAQSPQKAMSCVLKGQPSLPPSQTMHEALTRTLQRHSRSLTTIDMLAVTPV